ncbi:hypothetical protein J4Q44_G00280730 [Coregonus suidteri]|uniref:Uncharacterized protein n=1 Tax=Coregonus suidteri TaxID=861788 RepID=A0AAN8LAA9_9TELE
MCTISNELAATVEEAITAVPLFFHLLEDKYHTALLTQLRRRAKCTERICLDQLLIHPARTFLSGPTVALDA